MSRLNIAIDFDGTITAAPRFFTWMIYAMKHDPSYNMNPYIVTYRQADDYEDIENFVKNCPIPVIFTDGIAKRKYCEDLGIMIDIWIDDVPWAVENSLPFTDAERNEWLQVNNIKITSKEPTNHAPVE